RCPEMDEPGLGRRGINGVIASTAADGSRGSRHSRWENPSLADLRLGRLGLIALELILFEPMNFSKLAIRVLSPPKPLVHSRQKVSFVGIGGVTLYGRLEGSQRLSWAVLLHQNLSKQSISL